MRKNILGKFVKPAVLAECLRVGGLPSVDFKNPKKHVDNECLGIGFLTKLTITKLLREGDISSHQHAMFFRAVKAFLIQAAEYLLKWCPLKDELLTNATWLDFEHRLELPFSGVFCFTVPRNIR